MLKHINLTLANAKTNSNIPPFTNTIHNFLYDCSCVIIANHILFCRVKQNLQVRLVGRRIDKQTLIFAKSGIHIISRSQRPPSLSKQKSMIAEMVVAITNSNIESHSTI